MLLLAQLVGNIDLERLHRATEGAWLHPTLTLTLTFVRRSTTVAVRLRRRDTHHRLRHNVRPRPHAALRRAVHHEPGLGGSVGRGHGSGRAGGAAGEGDVHGKSALCGFKGVQSQSRERGRWRGWQRW